MKTTTFLACMTLAFAVIAGCMCPAQADEIGETAANSMPNRCAKMTDVGDMHYRGCVPSTLDNAMAGRDGSSYSSLVKQQLDALGSKKTSRSDDVPTTINVQSYKDIVISVSRDAREITMHGYACTSNDNNATTTCIKQNREMHYGSTDSVANGTLSFTGCASAKDSRIGIGMPGFGVPRVSILKMAYIISSTDTVGKLSVQPGSDAWDVWSRKQISADIWALRNTMNYATLTSQQTNALKLLPHTDEFAKALSTALDTAHAIYIESYNSEWR